MFQLFPKPKEIGIAMNEVITCISLYHYLPYEIRRLKASKQQIFIVYNGDLPENNLSLKVCDNP